MAVVNELLLFLHFVGLMLGAAGGVSSSVLMRRALSMPPDQAQTVRGLGPMLAKLSLAGLVLLWVTGIVLVWTRWAGPGSLPGLFWVKFIFILTLTAASVAIDVTYAQIKKGNAAVAARLPKLGPAAGLSALLAVLFAVVTFN